MSAAAPPNRNVLIIEDSDAQRAALARLLQEAGYQVRESPSCEQALTMLQTEPPPDAILLDWLLPGMSGWGFLTQLRRDPEVAALPVAVVSGFPEQAEQASLLSGVAFLPKPVERERLFAVLDELIEKKRPEILLVEDQADVSEVLGFLLRHHGFAVRQVGGGKRALEVYLRHQARIDLVLMDVQMPGLDGPQTLTALQQINPAVRGAFLTGNIGKYSAEQLLAQGALQIFEKPFRNIGEVMNQIRSLTVPPAP